MRWQQRQEPGQRYLSLFVPPGPSVIILGDHIARILTNNRTENYPWLYPFLILSFSPGFQLSLILPNFRLSSQSISHSSIYSRFSVSSLFHRKLYVYTYLALPLCYYQPLDSPSVRLHQSLLLHQCTLPAHQPTHNTSLIPIKHRLDTQMDKRMHADAQTGAPDDVFADPPRNPPLPPSALPGVPSLPVCLVHM